MTSLTSFSLFPALPTELRLKIWALNLPPPRIVHLHYTSSRANASAYFSRPMMRGCTSPTPIPTNLHVCHESRDEAMKVYKLCFHLEHARDKIWFDFQRDVLYFGERDGWLGGFLHWSDALMLISRGELAQVKRLAVAEALFCGMGGEGVGENTQATRIKDLWKLIMRKFLSVDEVVFVRKEAVEGVTNQGKWDWEENLEVRLLSGLEFVERRKGWKAPNWGIVELKKEEDKGENAWPRRGLLMRRPFKIESEWGNGSRVGHFGCFGHVRL